MRDQFRSLIGQTSCVEHGDGGNTYIIGNENIGKRAISMSRKFLPLKFLYNTILALPYRVNMKRSSIDSD